MNKYHNFQVTPSDDAWVPNSTIVVIKFGGCSETDHRQLAHLEFSTYKFELWFLDRSTILLVFQQSKTTRELRQIGLELMIKLKFELAKNWCHRYFLILRWIIFKANAKYYWDDNPFFGGHFTLRLFKTVNDRTLCLNCCSNVKIVYKFTSTYFASPLLTIWFV